MDKHFDDIRILEIINDGDSASRNIGFLILAFVAFHLALARFSYEWSRSQMRDRGQAIQQVLEVANKQLFSEKTKDGKPALFWEVSTYGLWLECNIRDIECTFLP